MRWIAWLLAIAPCFASTACKGSPPRATADARRRDSTASDAATTPDAATTVVAPDSTVESDVIMRARAMCAALAKRDPSARDFVRLPLRKRSLVSDACASGDVPCRYVTRTVTRLQDLSCAGWLGLDPSDSTSGELLTHTTKGTKELVESGIGQFPLYLTFENSPAGYVLVGISEENAF